MRHFRSISAALLVGAFVAPVSVVAQKALPVVVIENPGGDSEVRRPAEREIKIPRKLGWSTVLNSVVIVLELYGVACCDPPPQFTLTPGRLAYLRNGQGGALHFRTWPPSGGGGVISFSKNDDASIVLDHPGTALVELINLKPDYLYVLDFRVDGRDSPYDVAGNRTHSSNGHVLAVVTTDHEGNAWVTIDNVTQTDPKRIWDWLLYDVVVSELQPAR